MTDLPLSAAERDVMFSASEVACYRWPDDTEHHRELRAAFIQGAGYVATCQRVMRNDMRFTAERDSDHGR